MCLNLDIGNYGKGKMVFRGVLKKDSILNRDFLIDSNLEKNFFRFKLIGGFRNMVE